MRPTNNGRHRIKGLRRFGGILWGLRERMRPDAGVRMGASAGLVLLVCLLAGVDGLGTGPGLPGVIDQIPGVAWHIGEAALYGLGVRVYREMPFTPAFGQIYTPVIPNS